MEISDYSILPSVTVREAIEAIESIGKKAVLIVDRNNTLKGLFTDGDMRRFVLAGGNLSASVSKAMNQNPKVFPSLDEAIKFSKTNKLLIYPIVNNDGKLIDAIFWNEDTIEHSINQYLADVPVVIMAGGKGTRLHPYTNVLPKPLIPIGDQTICERIISSFKTYGANEFYIILNHMSNMIKAYFNEVEKDYVLNYVDEDEFLGSAGGLSLLKGKISSTFILSNCDVLIDTDYSDFYQFHKNDNNIITFAGALMNTRIPYGVLDMTSEGTVSGITEKPSYSYMTNAGVYIMEPQVIEDLQPGVYADLPNIAQKYIDTNERVGVYPVSEKSWTDMGQLKELGEMISAFTSQKG